MSYASGSVPKRAVMDATRLRAAFRRLLLAPAFWLVRTGAWVRVWRTA